MKYSTILTYKYAGQEWSINDEDYDTLTWLSDTPKPTKAELDAQSEEVKQIIEGEKQAKIDARNEALNKLAAIGLNESDLKALGL
jgi:hypothetical protein